MIDVSKLERVGADRTHVANCDKCGCTTDLIIREYERVEASGVVGLLMVLFYAETDEQVYAPKCLICGTPFFVGEQGH